MAKDIVIDKLPEWRLQAEIAGDLEKRVNAGQPFAYAASLEGVIGHLNPYQAKLAAATGVKAGEPDLRLYFAHGLAMVELKTATGSLTPSQKIRIPILRGLGFMVHIVKAGTLEEAVERVGVIVDAELASPLSSRDHATASWWPKERKPRA